MATDKRYALAPCSGMSPYGLITRAACSDTINERDDLISICMGATSADKEGFRELIKKFPIIAVNGCESSCVNKILKQKGVKVVKSINIQEELDSKTLKPNDVVRLDEEGEKCVLVIKKRINELVDD